jgi:hypothetical protein
MRPGFRSFQNPPPFERLVGDLAGAYSLETIFDIGLFTKLLKIRTLSK